MARKFLVVLMVVLMTVVIVFVGIAVPVRANADSEIPPDIVTTKILILLFQDPMILTELKNGTLGIVSYVTDKDIGFDIPGGNVGTDLIIGKPTSYIILPTTPVGLKLVKGTLYVYFSKIEVISVRWDILSIPPAESTFGERAWFPKFIPLQIVEAIPTGVETQTNYCCNPAVQKVSYGYRLFLSICKDPYNPPEEPSGDPLLYLNKYFMTEVMIPDYLISDFEQLIRRKDFLWIGLSGSSSSGNYNYIYWSH